MGVPELVWTVLGSIWVFAYQLSCGESQISLHVVQGLVIFNWILILVFIIGSMLVFDPLGHHYNPAYTGPANEAADNNRSAGLEVAFEQRSRLWEWRCKFLCCSCCSSNYYSSIFSRPFFYSFSFLISVSPLRPVLLTRSR